MVLLCESVARMCILIWKLWKGENDFKDITRKTCVIFLYHVFASTLENSESFLKTTQACTLKIFLIIAKAI